MRSVGQGPKLRNSEIYVCGNSQLSTRVFIVLDSSPIRTVRRPGNDPEPTLVQSICASVARSRRLLDLERRGRADLPGERRREHGVVPYGRALDDLPNRHNIYLHDTPSKSLFERTVRSFSHGCVRLQHPREMAAAILRKNVDYVDSQIARGDNHTEAVEDDIPVYLTYFTAWPDASGAIQFYDDVYKRDTYLKRALQKTEQARAEG